MKLHNGLVVFDLEATALETETAAGHRARQFNFIIDIGAVFIDRQLEVVDTFEHLVRPEEELTPFITNLTGITPAMLADQPTWAEVAQRFVAWVREHGSLKRVRLCAWGPYFDMPLLRQVYAHYELPFPFSGTCFDIKSFAMLWGALSGRRTDKIDVARTARVMGIVPEGPYHRAMADAKVEAKILQRVFRDLRDGMFLANAPGQPYSYLSVAKRAVAQVEDMGEGEVV